VAKLTVICWRDIPAQIVVRQGRDTAKVVLSARFQKAVDRAAMRAGKGSSGAYLDEWKRSAPRDCGDDLAAEAAAEARRIESRYGDDDLERLVRAHGVDDRAGAGTDMKATEGAGDKATPGASDKATQGAEDKAPRRDSDA
jgi:cvfA/B/C family virulence factor